MSLPKILYDNILASGVTATDTATDYSVDNIYDLRTYTYWTAASSGTKYITMDAGAAVDVDSLAIISHNFSTASATVSLEHDDNSGFTSPTEAIAGFAPTADTAIFKSFTSVSERYWRVKIVTAAVAARIGVVILGEEVEIPVYPDAPFTPKVESIIASTKRTKAGSILGSTLNYNPLTFSVSFDYPPFSFLDGDFKTFWDDHGKLLKPFFWVPNLSELDTDIYFVKFPDNFKLAIPQKNTSNADKLKLKFEGVAE